LCLGAWVPMYLCAANARHFQNLLAKFLEFLQMP
jgi:hypothetical protein